MILRLIIIFDSVGSEIFKFTDVRDFASEKLITNLIISKLYPQFPRMSKKSQ